MNVPKMLGATMVAGALAAGGAVAGITRRSGGAQLDEQRLDQRQHEFELDPKLGFHHAEQTRSVAENAAAAQRTVPEHGLRFEIRIELGLRV